MNDLWLEIRHAVRAPGLTAAIVIVFGPGAAERAAA
jgi:hypothetical protein